jgi:hypothetical protein
MRIGLARLAQQGRVDVRRGRDLHDQAQDVSPVAIWANIGLEKVVSSEHSPA